jgi:copper(I)-binding protein
MTRLLAFGFALLIAAFAPAAMAADIVVETAWARATPGNAPTGAVYFRVVNRGIAPDRLVAVTTPVAERAEIHENKIVDGVMQMRPLGGVTIEPRQSMELKPGGDHLMLIGLKHPLKQGESFPLTLVFEKAGTLTVGVAVEKVGASGGMGMDHGGANGGMGMDHGGAGH